MKKIVDALNKVFLLTIQTRKMSARKCFFTDTVISTMSIFASGICIEAYHVRAKLKATLMIFLLYSRNGILIGFNC